MSRIVTKKNNYNDNDNVDVNRLMSERENFGNGIIDNSKKRKYKVKRNNRRLKHNGDNFGEITNEIIENKVAHAYLFCGPRAVGKTTTARLLSKALEERELEYALDRYKKGEITIGRAAEIVKKDLREMMMIAAKREIPFQYGLKELREDYEAAINAK